MANQNQPSLKVRRSTQATLEQSPIQVLTALNVAWLQWLYENWYFQVDKLINRYTSFAPDLSRELEVKISIFMHWFCLWKSLKNLLISKQRFYFYWLLHFNLLFSPVFILQESSWLWCPLHDFPERSSGEIYQSHQLLRIQNWEVY